MASFHNLTVPADFRARVRLEGSPIEFSAEYRSFDQTDRQVIVNVPTTLASRYLREHPGVTLAQAETRIRALLDLPASLKLDIGVGETRGLFPSRRPGRRGRGRSSSSCPADLRRRPGAASYSIRGQNINILATSLYFPLSTAC